MSLESFTDKHTEFFSLIDMWFHVFNRSVEATEEHVTEALRLFNVSTMDAARSGINEHMNVTPELKNEIQVYW